MKARWNELDKEITRNDTTHINWVSLAFPNGHFYFLIVGNSFNQHGQVAKKSQCGVSKTLRAQLVIPLAHSTLRINSFYAENNKIF